MIGDIPFAAVRPPENILFVCKLNPVTADEDLELIFSRFGKILSCEVVRDKKSGDSLQYAFIEFDEQDSAEQVSSSPGERVELVWVDRNRTSRGAARTTRLIRSPDVPRIAARIFYHLFSSCYRFSTSIPHRAEVR
jgi:hypothetical protein